MTSTAQKQTHKPKHTHKLWMLENSHLRCEEWRRKKSINIILPTIIHLFTQTHTQRHIDSSQKKKRAEYAQKCMARLKEKRFYDMLIRTGSGHGKATKCQHNTLILIKFFSSCFGGWFHFAWWVFKMNIRIYIFRITEYCFFPSLPKAEKRNPIFFFVGSDCNIGGT